MSKGTVAIAKLRETRKRKQDLYIDTTTGQIKAEVELYADPATALEPRTKGWQAALFTED